IINALLAAVASQHDGAAFLLHYEVDILFRGVEDQFTAELIDKLHNIQCEKCFIWFHEACIRQSCISTCVFCDRI
uniref:Reverse transcriptase domain-containing protein n=1 Tax=Macrostomum lignano TaxID=282301 RepID=A0A1I8HFM5_9PLAT